LQPEQPAGVLALNTSVATPRPLSSATPVPVCRQAGPTDFPDEAAPTDVQSPPKAGTYRWNVSGAQSGTAVGTVQLPKTTRKIVTDVKVASNGWTFVQEEHDLVFGSTTTVRTTFVVLTQATADGMSAGIYLTQIQRIAGNQTSSFNPQPPVLYLPIPVTQGAPPGPEGIRTQDQIDSTGIDPVTQEVLRNQGDVTKRQRVDACGKVIDSWFVDAYQEHVSQGTIDRRNYQYSIATQYGGLIVFEHVETPCAQKNDDGTCTPAGNLKFDAGIAQVDPDPVPAGTK
jgi:hypothetical protein